MENNQNEVRVEEQQKIEQLPQKRKRGYIWLCIGLSIFFFISGAFTFWIALDKDMRTLIKVKLAIDREYYKEIDDDIFYGEIFRAINNGVLDDYSWYMNDEEYAETKKARGGNRSGVGLSFQIKDASGNSQMYIAQVSGNSPAEEREVLAGDYFIGFGESKDSIVDSVVFDEFSAFLSEQKDGQDFYVKVKRGEEELILALYKSAFVENYVFYRTNEKSYSFTGSGASTLTERGLPLTCLDKDTAYIRLTSFNGNAAGNFEKAMNLFKEEGKKHLILDLRGNGGGYMDILEKIASFFCKNASGDNPVISIADYGEKQEKFKASANVYWKYFQEDSRVMALADGNSASASEALLGCMVDYGATRYEDICLSMRNGVAKTFGKGIMQTTFPVVGYGGAIKLTTAELKWPVSKHSIHGRGILPEDGTKTVEENYQADAEIIAAVNKFNG